MIGVLHKENSIYILDDRLRDYLEIGVFSIHDDFCCPYSV